MNTTESDVAANSFSGKRVFITTLCVLVIGAACYWYGVNSVETVEPNALRMVGLHDPIEHRLDEQYSDANGDLVADAPQDEKLWLDPPTINFSYLASEQDRYSEVWANFSKFVGEKTGKPVKFVPQESADGQLQAIRNGELHLAGVNSGSVPLAVNNCGFVPICSFGADDKLATYRLQFIARSDSPVRKLEDIRSRQLALTEPTSNSGWKAPMIFLLREHKLKPILDYDIVQMRTHANSINAIAEGEQEIAAVASDELELAQSRGQIKKEDYVVIYESDPICNNVLGYVHNLKPELAESIEKAIYEFDWTDSKLAEEFSTIGASQLVSVDYKQDFKLIREIDNAMGRRHAIEERAKLRTPLLSDE